MIESNTDDWDRLPNGDIEVLPLAGWAVAAAPRLVLLRLEILTETGQIGTAQVAIPSTEAADLAQSLAFLAQRSEASDVQGQA